MKLHMIWAYDRYDEEWSCVDTWTDRQVEENYEGWVDALARYRAERDFLDVRLIDVSVPWAEIKKALKPPVVRGTATPARSEPTHGD